jgi:hypothetical protein
VPTDWVESEEAMQAITEQAAKEMEAQKLAAMVAGGGAAAQSLGDGMAAMQNAGQGGEAGAVAAA